MEETISRRSYAEVYDIIQHSSREIQEKIPRAFIKFLEENMSNERIKLNYNKQLAEQLEEVHYETRVIMGIIYRDFLCDAVTKEKLILQEKKDFAILEIQQKFSKNANLEEDENTEQLEEWKRIEENRECLALIASNDNSWYGKMWKKIKEFFKRKGWVLWE